jgi:hypothetical protein
VALRQFSHCSGEKQSNDYVEFDVNYIDPPDPRLIFSWLKTLGKIGCISCPEEVPDTLRNQIVEPETT